MLKRFAFFVFLLALLGCAHKKAPPVAPSQPSVQYVTETRKVGSFGKVYIRENLDVSLHSGYYKNPKVILKGAKSDLANVVVSNHNGSVTIDVGEGYPKHGRITAIIHAGDLRKFEYHGAGTIKGTKLSAHYLDLIIDNQGTTELGGYLGLRELDISGSGPVTLSGVASPYTQINLAGQSNLKMKGKAKIARLSLRDSARMSFYWVQSPHLTIRAYDKSYLQLAGVVDKMDVKLCNDAIFNGRYLRANRAFVKTFDHSLAEISAVRRQHTLASDSSDIHFYNLPVMRTDFLAFDGSVLDMRNLGLPHIQEYDEYNKYLQM